jgi:hypothetical protein
VDATVRGEPEAWASTDAQVVIVASAPLEGRRSWWCCTFSTRSTPSRSFCTPNTFFSGEEIWPNAPNTSSMISRWTWALVRCVPSESNIGRPCKLTRGSSMEAEKRPSDRHFRRALRAKDL